jgi:ADP-glucose type glycogen/starch synthase
MMPQNDTLNEINKEYKKLVPKSQKPKVLICTPEITELPEGMGNAANLVTAKGGGMGDISASLIRYLQESGDYELHIVLPKYDNKIRHMAKFTNKQLDRLAIILSGKGIHLVNDSAFSYLKNPYEENKLHSRVRRALVFQRYIINNLLDWIQPDVVHCNDWMTALVPAAAKSKGIKSLFTLHNIFTEKQSLMNIELSGLKPIEFMQHLYFEKFPEDLQQNWKKHFTTNRVDFTASAVMACDYFNTVSKTFLEELVHNYYPDIVPSSVYQTIKDKYGMGRAVGIVNAPNDTVNPKIMPNIINFNKHTMPEKKAENKALFQAKMGLPQQPDIPLFFWPNRLYYQKAPDILLDNLEYFNETYKFQLAVVANGDTKYEKQIKKIASKYTNIAYRNFQEELSNLGKAGADFILMPSRYEPCGLPQMEVLRFGTLPIVRSTGGLKDTISSLDIKHSEGNGFVFLMADKEGLEYGISEALQFYKQPKDLKINELRRIMSSSKRQFNLKNTAKQYMKIYDKLINEK